MIVQEVKFVGEDYSKIINLKSILENPERSSHFHREENPRKDHYTPEIIHFTYPHTDSKRYYEQVLTTLYLWEKEKTGKITFVTPSKKAFEKCKDVLEKLLEMPIKTNSSIKTICIL